MSSSIKNNIIGLLLNKSLLSDRDKYQCRNREQKPILPCAFVFHCLQICFARWAYVICNSYIWIIWVCWSSLFLWKTMPEGNAWFVSISERKSHIANKSYVFDNKYQTNMLWRQCQFLQSSQAHEKTKSGITIFLRAWICV